MNLSMTQSHRQSQELEQRLEQRQKIHQLQAQRLELRLSLLQVLYGINANDVYRPQAKCPKCGHILTTEEILRGFNRDPQDLTTRCSRCNQRFEARLVSRGMASEINLRFYCPAQALHALPTYRDKTPEEIHTTNSALFESVRLHFGGFREAFRQIGITYRPRRQPDWQEKVKPFLGQAPDTLIASVAEVSPATIRRLRRRHGIGRYQRTEN